MYENKTFESIMTDMLSRVPATMDKREGSVIRDALAPAAVELQNLYIQLDTVLNETFADTASLYYLKKRTAERGIVQTPATKAVLKGEFTPTSLELSIGARFSCDVLNYKITEKISAGNYKLECETAGTEGNTHFGTLIPIDYIAGLETANLTQILIPAEDAETADHLRERYFNSMTSQAYGGNIADYREKTTAINGVGGVKVTPTWNGGGTVKLMIIASNWTVPTQTLIDTVQNTIDPVGHSGEGYGLAPIGHVVTVVGVGSTTVNITATFTYNTGWNWALAKPYIKAAIDQYFTDLSETWDEQQNLVVRISQLESKLLALDAVLDISGTTLNGSASNLSLAADRIPIRGTTVNSTNATTVNIVSTFTYNTGWDWTSAKQYIKDTIDSYFRELAETENNNLVVSISQLESKILDLDAISSVTGTTLNGSASDLSLDTYKDPVRGTVNGES